MHFFYLDETGCSGRRLSDPKAPIFVLGGISVRDKGWVETTEKLECIIKHYFNPNPVPAKFEIHAHELSSPNGDGPFAGHDLQRRKQFIFDLLDLIESRKHHVHFVAIDKAQLAAVNWTGAEDAEKDARAPYLLSFDYMTTLINDYVKEKLGRSARGIIILDEKKQFADEIDAITRFRRFEVDNKYRIKQIVEFSYPIDSEKHPMIQLSDLVIYYIKKFFEMDAGYKEDWLPEAKEFYAQCFQKIYSRVRQKTLVQQKGDHAKHRNALLGKVTVKPRNKWEQHYAADLKSPAQKT